MGNVYNAVCSYFLSPGFPGLADAAPAAHDWPVLHCTALQFTAVSSVFAVVGTGKCIVHFVMFFAVLRVQCSEVCSAACRVACSAACSAVCSAVCSVEQGSLRSRHLTSPDGCSTAPQLQLHL